MKSKKLTIHFSSLPQKRGQTNAMNYNQDKHLKTYKSIMDFKIIQWNLAGFFSHYEEVRNLMRIHNPVILMLQETHFNTTDNDDRILRGYNFVRNDDPTAILHRKGGSAIGIRQDFKHVNIPLRTALQAVAVKLSYPIEFSICSIYIPPGENVSEQAILELLKQLPHPVLIGGDLNARNSIWGSDRTDRRGKIIENAMNSEDLNLLNTGDHTLLHRLPVIFSN